MPLDGSTLAPERAQTPIRVGRLERLPKWLNLIPSVMQWIWLGICYRSFTLPSTANPAITAGGLVGEGKLEYFASMGPLARAATADYASLPMDGDASLERALAVMQQANLAFPVVVKPDMGWCGFGVRLVADAEALRQYLDAFPRGQTVVFQRYLPEAGEAGIFYMRDPGQTTGQVIGILLRQFPRVTGDGQSTIAELIAQDARLRRATRNSMHDCDYAAARIPAPGENVRLSMVASNRVGGLYLDASDLLTPQLSARVDAIARDMDRFHAGRFDVRYASEGDLAQGLFTIMEVNGSGSEAVHAWDPKYSLREAYAIIFSKQRLLFRIADANRQRGYQPIGLLTLARLHLTQQALMRRYPKSN